MLHHNTLKYSCTFLKPQRMLCSTRDELLEVNTRKKRWYTNGMMSKETGYKNTMPIGTQM